MQMNLTEIAQALGIDTKLIVTDSIITNVVFDSRKATAGSLFVPLIAARDGHDFVQAAFDNGASATLWQQDHSVPETVTNNYLVVKDTLAALQKLSYYYLHKINPQVVAITGSNGKTTTKDMTAAVLAQKYQVVKTQANHNNEIGVPITILSMAADTQILVVEMGMDRAGQLAALSALVQPDVAVITMIGEAHIEFFGTRDKIADAKMEITQSLKTTGTFIYNGDEPLLRQRARNITQKQLTFGQSAQNDLTIASIMPAKKQTTFSTNIDPQQQIVIPMLGDYNVDNALAAILVGRCYQVEFAQIKTALEHFQPTKNRTQWLQATNGAQILSDVYNANPTAMIDVINNFSQVPTTGRRILVLGDMLELGQQAAYLHAQIGQAISEEKIAAVYLYGELMQSLKTALAERLPVYYFKSGQMEDLIEKLQEDLQPTDLVLLKASNGLHLDRVLQALVK
ncbi:UDP-N-acetylmuramoyl-tripeptide--D-alanyl-D-alanine ligase [Bombilactobacillus bombi]|uniref:UDP-N-acetylmuramoyl-tripeptide--D-alanyl-D-alanine ligase n=1 Tax=Bombilactobacillus bombi TaxID=1303590 RepID=A0A3R6UZX2_9LACO|nr:UDP-N-acetylmuramoyl-tripeptide--D-alanyl-D-alanine ligase [Bombilactobacillus bombi]RHW51943.1 UDP-N-acetylmuramoyl-tripeptide--D-alanyl-D-alanine ligase [Bombilactobacillus bombi]